ncbi:MAG: hypothetical protein K0Q94_3328 [Paenibacillus sp.]|uniref:hypothetical protein n=1 Tax=unclassified Paenibacillus TaxID=185978 RepID=UPI0029E86C82|nr:hypothetical protein [Paenibacillus sp.]
MKIHIVAGILVGYFNDIWQMVLVASVLWGIVFCAFMLKSYKERKERYLARLKSLDKEKEFGLSPKIAYYIREFIMAVGMAFMIGTITLTVKSMAG